MCSDPFGRKRNAAVRMKRNARVKPQILFHLLHPLTLWVALVAAVQALRRLYPKCARVLYCLSLHFIALIWSYYPVTTKHIVTQNAAVAYVLVSYRVLWA